MKEEKIIKAECGDVVQLKSGGPLMTVNEITDAEFVSGMVGCMWHDVSGEMNRASLAVDALDFVKQAEPSGDKCAVKVDPTPTVEDFAKVVTDTLEEKLGEQFGTERKQPAEPRSDVADVALAAAEATGELVG